MKNLKYLFLLILFIPWQIMAVTREEYNNAVANIAIDAATTYSDEFAYSYRWGGTPSNPSDKMDVLQSRLASAKKGIKTEFGYIYGSLSKNAGIQGSFKNKFGVYCGTFVSLMIHHASNGQVNQGDDYETIKLSELQRGDLIHFENHIAIYIDDGNDNSPDTWRIAEASSKIQVRVRSYADYGYRIKDSSLSKLDYNIVNASYDFHDRLDDYAPIITNVSEIENTNKVIINATDFKHYELPERSDVLEPESNGIVAYQITKTPITPTTDWKMVNKTDTLNIEVEVDGNGSYYVYVKDVGGNVTIKNVNLTKIIVDKELPTLGEFSYEGLENSIKINVIGATDNIGIKEYRYYLDGKLSVNTKDSIYEIKNLLSNKEYEFYYEVVDNSNNAVRSQTYKITTEIDADDIEIAETKLYLVKNDTFKLNPKIIIKSNNYKIKYKSSNENIAKVSENGEIVAINSGTCEITISVGRTKKSLIVKVSTYQIVYNLAELPVAYIGEEYNTLIETNYPGVISLEDSTLPDGLYLENNTIKGSPKENTSGNYSIKFISKYLDSESVREYSFSIKYNIEFETKNLEKAYLNKEYTQIINANYPVTITLESGKLPQGMNIVNNKIVGTPTETGTYTFTLNASYMNSETDKNFTIIVYKHDIFFYIIITSVIIALFIVIYLIIKYYKQKKTNKNKVNIKKDDSSFNNYL